MPKPQIVIADNHEQVYPVWEERGLRRMKLTHVDFHCDMRGIMIDRKSGRAFFVSERETRFIDRGNFLAHAIMNGMVSDLCWVHGPMGGRSHDIGPVVSYETDYLAPLHRYHHKRSNRPEVPIQFHQGLLADWKGTREGEILDIDWDTFASVEYSPDHRTELVEAFFSKDFTHIPELTTLIYSPGYSDPDRSLFHAFADRLAKTLGAEITELPSEELNTEGMRSGALRNLVLGLSPDLARKLKRSASRAWRKMESRNDLDFYKKAS